VIIPILTASAAMAPLTNQMAGVIMISNLVSVIALPV
jgi:hypothetical protein